MTTLPPDNVSMNMADFRNQRTSGLALRQDDVLAVQNLNPLFQSLRKGGHRTFLHAEGGRTLIGTDKRKLVLRRQRCQGRGSAGDRQTDRLHKEDCHRIKVGENPPCVVA